MLDAAVPMDGMNTNILFASYLVMSLHSCHCPSNTEVRRDIVQVDTTGSFAHLSYTSFKIRPRPGPRTKILRCLPPNAIHANHVNLCVTSFMHLFAETLMAKIDVVSAVHVVIGSVLLVPKVLHPLS